MSCCGGGASRAGFNRTPQGVAGATSPELSLIGATPLAPEALRILAPNIIIHGTPLSAGALVHVSRNIRDLLLANNYAESVV